MGWFKKIIFTLIALLMPVDSEENQSGNNSSVAGPDTTAEEKAIVAEQAKKIEPKRNARKSDQNQKLVVDGAKIQCTLCSNPSGTLKVTYDTPSIQDKLAATVVDKGKPNLLFAGTCSKSFNSSSACASMIQPDKWMNTGSFKIQNQSPLLLKSTIKCLYGGVDIKITDCGQRNNFAYDLGTETEENVEEKISIAISVFFDGTGNNKNNTEARLEYDKKMKNKPFNDKVWPYDAVKAGYYETSGNKKDDSYENDLSNVSRLFKYYEEDTTHATDRTGCVYVEGIGTVNYKSDDLFPGTALGEGSTGILAKVEKGCELTSDKIKSVKPTRKNISTITIDVFGFSRGAAAARNFIYEITKPGKDAYIMNFHTAQVKVPAEPAHGALGKYLQTLNITFERLEIRFAGLFDTVSSHGMDKTNDVADLQLTAVSRAKSTLHLVAADEHRENFPLIQIQSAGTKGVTKYLPGAHSDIGGCYVQNATEYVDELIVGDGDTLETGKDQLLEQGWYRECELKIHNIIGKVSGTRKLDNAYSFIPLYSMCDYAMASPRRIKFQSEKLYNKFIIPESLKNIQKRIEDHMMHDMPMEFYSRKELDAQIKQVRSLYERKTFDTSPILSGSQGYSTSVALNMQASVVLPLDPEVFNDQPLLKRRIEDHYMLLELRNKYLHWSANYDGIGMDPNIQSGKRRRINYPG